jgi:hypothetical protein
MDNMALAKSWNGMRRATRARWAGLSCRQMPSFGGDIGIYVEEWSLNEDLVGIPSQCDGLCDVRLIVGEIDHVSDFLPGRYTQDNGCRTAMPAYASTRAALDARPACSMSGRRARR